MLLEKVFPLHFVIIYVCQAHSKQVPAKQNALPIYMSSKFGARYGPTKFSYLSPEDFKEIYLSDLKPVYNKNYTVKPVSNEKLRQLNIPRQLDWRTYLNHSTISAVKNQNKCGGCWAFSTVETVESMFAIATGKAPPNLSVQEVIDCSYNNYGCAGGDTCLALKWMQDSHTPLVSNSVYPLKDESNICKLNTNTTTGIKVAVDSYKCYRGIQETKILELLQQGPVVAAVDARTWMNYQGGIIQYHCQSNVNHAVQIIGYNLTGEVPYYIVRNSWGADFGHDGYLYIRIGNNVCGISHEIATVSVYV